MAGPEATIERWAAKWCKDRGITFLKMTPQGDTGWPDRLIIFPNGYTLWVEFKRPGGIVSPKQNWVHNKLRNLGHRVEVCDDKEEFVAVTKDALSKATGGVYRP